MKTAAFVLLGALALLSQTAPRTAAHLDQPARRHDMAAALSPDGRTLMIDLQGSLWTLPASGGPAQRITDEYLDARQPAWAPDNRRVAFQGYRRWRLAHLRDERRRLGPARDHLGPV